MNPANDNECQHEWQMVYEERNEYEPELINGKKVCKKCGEYFFYTRKD